MGDYPRVIFALVMLHLPVTATVPALASWAKDSQRKSSKRIVSLSPQGGSFFKIILTEYGSHLSVDAVTKFAAAPSFLRNSSIVIGSVPEDLRNSQLKSSFTSTGTSSSSRTVSSRPRSWKYLKVRFSS